MFVAIYLRARGHEHVFRETDSSQAKVGALRPFDGGLCAVGYDDHEVHIAVVSRRTPGARTEQPNLLRLKFGLKSFDCGFQEASLNGLHSIKTSIIDVDLKAVAGACQPLTKL